eukprot:TRINITY_DN7468_c0_g3_i1.p1 TRINITY_DN7468_c0_g3~~TRINITY_DN7468_c0_g3_i1.p1  ORF type:complete len:203 (+),score=37.14 TRINITY_DN7468_c0_g3_i1:682-1290(+)
MQRPRPAENKLRGRVELSLVIPPRAHLQDQVLGCQLLVGAKDLHGQLPPVDEPKQRAPHRAVVAQDGELATRLSVAQPQPAPGQRSSVEGNGCTVLAARDFARGPAAQRLHERLAQASHRGGSTHWMREELPKLGAASSPVGSSAMQLHAQQELISQTRRAVAHEDVASISEPRGTQRLVLVFQLRRLLQMNRIAANLRRRT